MMKKSVMMFVLLLLCSSIFAFAQETSDEETVAKECGVGCKIWQFLFGSAEARAGRAWFDRSEALVGEADETTSITGWQKLSGTENQYLCYKDDGCGSYVKGQVAIISSEQLEEIENQQAQQEAADEINQQSGSDSKVSGQTGYGPTVETKQGESAPKPAESTSKQAASKPAATQPTTAAPTTQAATTTLNDVLTWTQETNNQFTKPGTVYKNAKGAYFITNDKGVGEKVEAAAALQKLQKNAAASPVNPNIGKLVIDQTAKSQLESALGKDTYEDFAKKLKANDVFTRSDGTLVMRGIGGVITVAKPNDEEIQTGQRTDGKGNVLDSYLIKDGQILASQDAKGNVKVGDASYASPKGKNIASTDSLEDLKEGIQLSGKEGPSGLLKLDGDVFTAVDYETETFQRITKNEKETGKVDYYRKGVSGCKTEGGCYVPIDGEVTFTDADGKAQSYLVDREYDTDFGAVRELKQKELFDPRTGRKDGIELSDGTLITRQQKLTDQDEQVYLVRGKDGTTIEAKKINDNWRPVTSPSFMAAQEKYDQAVAAAAEAESNRLQNIGPENSLKAEEAKEALKKAEEELNTERDNENELSNKLNSKETEDAFEELETEKTLAGFRTAIQSVYAITNNLKSYPAISNLLFGKADFYTKWRSEMDKAFAPLLGSNWVPSAICENGISHWQDIEPEGKAVIKTTSGTYQAVASIQMERSPETSPILCHKNPDTESEESFICDTRQACVDDSFCYADQDRDNEPDSNEPLKGYFYKVTWAVSSPQDEAFTPLKDEDGIAVSFNVFLYPGTVPLYNLNGNIASPIQLQNGASDRDAIIKYSTNVYDHACIRWNQAPISIGIGGKDVGAGVAGYGAIEDVCFNVVTSTVGQVNWERSGQNAGSVTVSHGELSRNTNW